MHGLVTRAHAATRALRLPSRTMFSATKLPGSNTVQVYDEKRVLGYSQAQMFEVVAQVEKYKNFVPWCKRSDVISRYQNGLKAELVIGFPPLAGESYTSRVTFFEPNLVIAVCEDLNLFDHLKTVWTLKPGPEGFDGVCLVEFAVSFKFKQRTHSMISRIFFDEVVRQNVRAFLKEAKRRFGPEKDLPESSKT